MKVIHQVLTVGCEVLHYYLVNIEIPWPDMILGRLGGILHCYLDSASKNVCVSYNGDSQIISPVRLPDL